MAGMEGMKKVEFPQVRHERLERTFKKEDGDSWGYIPCLPLPLLLGGDSPGYRKSRLSAESCKAE